MKMLKPKIDPLVELRDQARVDLAQRRTVPHAEHKRTTSVAHILDALPTMTAGDLKKVQAAVVRALRTREKPVRTTARDTARPVAAKPIAKRQARRAK